jgi:hypothetical protein
MRYQVNGQRDEPSGVVMSRPRFPTVKTTMKRRLAFALRLAMLTAGFVGCRDKESTSPKGEFDQDPPPSSLAARGIETKK